MTNTKEKLIRCGKIAILLMVTIALSMGSMGSCWNPDQGKEWVDTGSGSSGGGSGSGGGDGGGGGVTGIPAAPSNLILTSVPNLTSRRITLTWTDNSNNETGFIIERTTSGDYTEVARVGANVTTYTDTGVTVQTIYYRVRAYNASGSSYVTIANI
jgi:hypothetical protein